MSLFGYYVSNIAVITCLLFCNMQFSQTTDDNCVTSGVL